MNKRIIKIATIVTVCLVTGVGGIATYKNYNTEQQQAAVVQQQQEKQNIEQQKEVKQVKQENKEVAKKEQIKKEPVKKETTKKEVKNNQKQEVKKEITENKKEEITKKTIEKKKVKTPKNNYKKTVVKEKKVYVAPIYFNDSWSVWNTKPSRSFNGKSDMKNKVRELTQGVTSDRTKAKIIFNWVINNVTYSDSLAKSAARETNSPYQLSSDYTFKNGTGICYNFAVVYSNMLRYAGIRSKVQDGSIVMNGKVSQHAWNRVLINGEWIKVDCTGHRFGYFKYKHIFKITLMEV